MTRTTLDVDGMTCNNCATHVTEALQGLPGVTGVEVDLRSGAHSPVIVISDQALDTAAATAAVDDAGYTVVDIH